MCNVSLDLSNDFLHVSLTFFGMGTTETIIEIGMKTLFAIFTLILISRISRKTSPKILLSHV